MVKTTLKSKKSSVENGRWSFFFLYERFLDMAVQRKGSRETGFHRGTVSRQDAHLSEVSLYRSQTVVSGPLWSNHAIYNSTILTVTRRSDHNYYNYTPLQCSVILSAQPIYTPPQFLVILSELTIIIIMPSTTQSHPLVSNHTIYTSPILSDPLRSDYAIYTSTILSDPVISCYR